MSLLPLFILNLIKQLIDYLSIQAFKVVLSTPFYTATNDMTTVYTECVKVNQSICTCVRSSASEWGGKWELESINPKINTIEHPYRKHNDCIPKRPLYSYPLLPTVLHLYSPLNE